MYLIFIMTIFKDMKYFKLFNINKTQENLYFSFES